jgi:hypothetical protein
MLHLRTLLEASFKRAARLEKGWTSLDGLRVFNHGVVQPGQSDTVCERSDAGRTLALLAVVALSCW